MTDGIRCGLEEPIQSNEQILATDAAGTAQLATFSVPELNRYSFVWTHPGPISFDVLEVFLGYEQGQRCVVVGWNHDLAGFDRIRSLGTERALARAGWEVRSEQGLGLGCKSVQRLEGSVFPSVPKGRVGWFVMVGTALSPAQMLGDPFLTTVRSFCRTSMLEPSREFLEGLVTKGVSLAYPSKGPSDLHGIILVSPLVLSSHIGKLQAAGVISAVWPSDAAASVWLRQPDD